jgi:hypothetical protein
MEANTETRKIEIEQETLNYLNTTRKWTMFFAIIGFIFLGLMIIIGIAAGTFLSAFKSGAANTGIPEILIFIILFALAVMYFFPILFLFRFSKHTANAVHSLNKEELRKAFKNLKSYFVYLGIMVIIGLSLYVVALIVAGTSIAFLKGL